MYMSVCVSNDKTHLSYLFQIYSFIHIMQINEHIKEQKLEFRCKFCSAILLYFLVVLLLLFDSTLFVCVCIRVMCKDLISLYI